MTATVRQADPHAGGRVVSGGAPLARASLTMIMLHGRGGSPEDMLSLAEHLALPDIACLAPSAAGGSWWPQSFLAPLAANQPELDSALSAVERLAGKLANEGFGPGRLVVLGFSQGACLALEYAARSGRSHRAVAGLSGGLVGTGDAPGAADPALYGQAPKMFDYDGRLDGTPVLLGCHERDPHIPLARVRTSAEVFGRLGARVETLIHPGAGHAVVADEIAALRAMLNR
jgi:phospholipase/carboxylesterase